MARREAFKHKLPLEPVQHEQIAANLAASAHRLALRDATINAVWWDSELRIEDLCGLTAGQLRGKSTFTVVQGKVSIASAVNGKRKPDSVKCYLTPRTMALVERYLAEFPRSDDAPAFTGQGRTEWKVYERTSTNGTKYVTRVGIACDQVRQLFKVWVADIGLDPSLYSTHSVRRGRITAQWRSGVRPRIIQTLAGHKDARSTMGYDSPSDDEIAAVALAR